MDQLFVTMYHSNSTVYQLNSQVNRGETLDIFDVYVVFTAQRIWDV